MMRIGSNKGGSSTVLTAIVMAVCVLLVMSMWMNQTSQQNGNQKTAKDELESRVALLERDFLRFQLQSELKNERTQETVRQQQPIREEVKSRKGSKTTPAFVSRSAANEVVSSWSERQERLVQGFFSGLSIPSISGVRMQDGDVVLDIGANLGKFTQSVRRHCPSCTIFSFECVPEYAAHIVSKIVDEKDQKIFVIASGLSDAKEKATLFMDSSNLGWNSLVQEKTQSSMVERVVDLVPLDELELPLDRSRVRLIKIDTEGAEHKVLKGAHQFLSSLSPKPILLIEVAWGAQGNPNWDKVKTEFEWLFSNGWKRTDISQLSGTSDVLVYPM
jgi:FkbM family methyltransferase